MMCLCKCLIQSSCTDRGPWKTRSQNLEGDGGEKKRQVTTVTPTHGRESWKLRGVTANVMQCERQNAHRIFSNWTELKSHCSKNTHPFIFLPIIDFTSTLTADIPALSLLLLWRYLLFFNKSFCDFDSMNTIWFMAAGRFILLWTTWRWVSHVSLQACTNMAWWWRVSDLGYNKFHHTEEVTGWK